MQVHPAQAYARSEGLRSRSDVCDASGIETLNCSDRCPGVAKLGVVIVFDHKLSVRRNPFDESKATDGSHNDSGRKLVGRGTRDAICCPANSGLGGWLHGSDFVG